jgi:hypothetical protein
MKKFNHGDTEGTEIRIINFFLLRVSVVYSYLIWKEWNSYVACGNDH